MILGPDCLVVVAGVTETGRAWLEQCQDGLDFARKGQICQLVCIDADCGDGGDWWMHLELVCYADCGDGGDWWMHLEQCWDCSDCQDRLDLPASLLLNLCIP